MSKFPVEKSDEEGVVDALNYLLSGPAGLGQNFAGVSFSDTGYLTGNFRIPFTTTTPQPVYVAPIALATAELLDPTTWKFTFASAQPTPPFGLGNAIKVVGVSDPFFDGTYVVGVSACTTTYVITRTAGSYANPGSSTGGTVGLNLAGGDVSTDGDARVTINSASDRVFVSAQLTNTISYLATQFSQMFYSVKVNRYKAFPSGDAVNPDFLFDLDETVAYRNYNYTTLTPTESAVSGASPLTFSGTKAISAVTYPVTYNVLATTVTGSGSLLNLNITLLPTGAVAYSAANTEITVVSGGQQYAIGDTLLVTGDLLGGTTPANDMSLTVDNINSGTVTLSTVDTVFTNIIDVPKPGYYRYILEVEFVTDLGGDATITECQLGYRSLACQVVKE
jgi:hypothetical protein